MDNESDAEIKARHQRRWRWAWIISSFLILGSAFFTFAGKNSPFVCCLQITPRNACIANLRQIEGAKQTWALENKKRADAVAVDADLYGPQLYIRDKPECPGGGRYSIRPVGLKTRCSVYGHTI